MDQHLQSRGDRTLNLYHETKRRALRFGGEKAVASELVTRASSVTNRGFKGITSVEMVW